jgi:Tfp pilus assembly protein PilX
VNRRIAKNLFLGERGIALPMALGIMMVLSIALVTVLELSSSGQRSSNISKAEQVALAVAEAGLNEAHSVLADAADPASSSALPASCDVSPDVAAEGGTACYWGSLGGNTWTISAQSTVQNPSGGAAITHTVSEQVAVSSSPATTANNQAWNYIYSDSPTGCMILQSSVQIKQKVYVKNDLCLGSSAQIYAEASEVSVGGEITVDSSAWIGQGTPLPTLNLGSTSAGCRKGAFDSNGNPIGGGGYSYPCTAGSHQVNATTQNHTIPNVSKPPVDLAARYLALGNRPEMTEKILAEHALTTEWVLNVTGHSRLLEDRRVLGRAVALRNPYVDALSYLQVRALGTLRNGDDDAPGEDEVRRLLQISVNGVAAGLQNTG